MSTDSAPPPPESGQWLDLGLEAVEPGLARRVRLFRRLMATAAVFRGQIDALFADAGVTSQQAALLQLIEAQPQPPTLGQVAQALRMTHQNAKQIALALQRKGFLDIVVDSADRRARRLQLTDLHHRTWRQRNSDDFAQVGRWTDDLSDAEVAQAVDLLDRLRRSLQRHRDAGR
jgi:DNA-binding MarR family transcriptional regulator